MPVGHVGSDSSGIVLLVALFAWLAWSRYLHHKEVLALHDRGGDWQVLVALRERWRIRWGMLAGIIVLLAGAGGLAAGLVIMQTTDRVGDRVGGGVVATFGGSVAAVGLVVLIAHIIWGRGRAAAAACSDSASKS